MTLTPELPGTDVVIGRWLTDHSWNRPTWTIAELEAAKPDLLFTDLSDAQRLLDRLA